MNPWRRQQIATDVAVTGLDIAVPSNQLVGAGVINPQGDDLGSVDDVVMSPLTGKIANLVIACGGISGFDKKYVIVPWFDFKAAPGNKLLVLASAIATMDTTPRVKEDQNFQKEDLAAKNLKVNAYRVAHLAP
jgi:sporulation protein YlmC with PRC-barrel domain